MADYNGIYNGFQSESNQPERDAVEKTETNIFDKEEIVKNCTVQILTNSITGEVSVGWWKNDC